jgi:hypothetical protein
MMRLTSADGRVSTPDPSLTIFNILFRVCLEFSNLDYPSPLRPLRRSLCIDVMELSLGMVFPAPGFMLSRSVPGVVFDCVFLGQALQRILVVTELRESPVSNMRPLNAG